MPKKDIYTSDEDVDMTDAPNDAAPPAAQPQNLQLQLNPNTQAQLASIGQGSLPNGQLSDPTLAPPSNVPRPYVPQTGATSPGTLNLNEYASTQLQNLEGMKGLIQQGADIIGATGDKEASILSQSNNDQQLALMHQELAGQKALQDSNDRLVDMKKQVDAAAQEKVDPNHWFNSKSTGGKVAAMIGTFLMGLHSPRLAMETVHNLINDDINSQKDNIANHWKSIKEAHEIDDTAFNRAQHDQEWRTNYRLGALEVVKNKLAQAAAESKNPMAQNNAAMAIQQISQQQDTIRYQSWQNRQKALVAQWSGQAALQKRLRDEAVEARKQQVDLMNNASAPMSEKDASETVARMHPELVQYGLWGAGGGQMKATPPVTNAEKTQAREGEKDLETRTVQIPQEMGGGVGIARDAAAAKDYTERVAGTKNWMQKFEQVKNFQKKWEEGTLTQEDIGNWESLNADLTNTMNSTFAVTRQAGVGEGERIAKELLPQPPGTLGRILSQNDKILGSPYNWSKQDNSGKIKAIDSFMPERLKQAMGDLTPLRGDQPNLGGEAPADYSKFGFKPAEPSTPAGPAPSAIPNVYQPGQANAPGIPSFSQYQRGQ